MIRNVESQKGADLRMRLGSHLLLKVGDLVAVYTVPIINICKTCVMRYLLFVVRFENSH